MSASIVSQRSRPEYYEAIFQVRSNDPGVLVFVQEAIAKQKDVFVSKMERSKRGVDIYLSSQRFARALGKRVKRVFPQGKLVVTKKLFGRNRQTSRLMYRATVLFKQKEGL